MVASIYDLREENFIQFSRIGYSVRNMDIIVKEISLADSESDYNPI